MGGTVIIGPGFLHRTGLGRLLIPHPPLINWLLRQGLLENSCNALRVTHEFGHLQSAPLAVLYTALNYTAIITANRATLSNLILVFISTHAAWEIMSEILTIVIDPQFYHKCYQRVSLVPRAIFWFSTIALTLMGWIILLL
jgi:ABC-type enterochelin transport system permease subunit